MTAGSLPCRRHIAELGGLVEDLSKQTPKKSLNINSATGRRPVTAAPAAAPKIADSVIGVSMTELRELAEKPLGHPEHPA